MSTNVERDELIDSFIGMRNFEWIISICTDVIDLLYNWIAVSGHFFPNCYAIINCNFTNNIMNYFLSQRNDNEMNFSENQLRKMKTKTDSRDWLRDIEKKVWAYFILDKKSMQVSLDQWKEKKKYWIEA